MSVAPHNIQTSDLKRVTSNSSPCISPRAPNQPILLQPKGVLSRLNIPTDPLPTCIPTFLLGLVLRVALLVVVLIPTTHRLPHVVLNGENGFAVRVTDGAGDVADGTQAFVEDLADDIADG